MEENLIYEYEERLRKAMLNGDVENLDRLISDELSFVSPFGQIITKKDDIESHRSGIVNITEIKFLNQKVIPLEDVAVTITQANVKAILAGEHREDEMCYTRVWQKDKNELKVISGHCSFVQK
ncbi:nuclear transport factor 2 family protein [Metabacillus fastidiosus]|uniref:Nuclear transport factor 2 family protein n=1 Tax=Metabacillus fastidiosus TaxID=1458 RepID=A0ABU6NZ18_9BACI|nr:nuclear transport factor 2 family protein [Metabacillus fastidiosus]